MQRERTLLGMVAFALLALLSACSTDRTAQPVDDIGLGEYTDTTLEFPMMRYAAGELTINDRCPVRKAKLNRRLSPLFVNGKPLGFC